MSHLSSTGRSPRPWLPATPTSAGLPGWALLPLRAFLGITFMFAGIQKLANPSFFNAANPASIQAQMTAAARRSPIHALLTPLSHQAVIIGVVIAIGEIAAGVGAFFGLFTRIAAIGGVLISLNLFLAVSFHTNPYYTGSDIVFVFAWLPLLIAGGGPFSLDMVAANLAAAHDLPVDTGRRRLLGAMTLGVGVFALIGASTAAGLGRLLHTTSPSTNEGLGSGSSTGALTPSGSAPLSSQAATSSAASSAVSASSASTAATPSASPQLSASPTVTPSARTTPVTKPTPTPTPSKASATPTTNPTPTPPKATPSKVTPPKPPGTNIGAASGVPVRGAATFQDPASGDPAIVVQPRAGTFLAFDAVCPHAGCTVDYDAQNAQFVCPCHGSQFNGTTGSVEVGPASRGLAKISIAEGSDGQLYVK